MHKTGLDRNGINARDCPQYAFVGSGLFRPCSIEYRNAEPGRSLRGGDLVRLRSGGPLMTVEGIKGDQVDCFWTDPNGQMNAQSFPIYVLQKS